MGWKLFDGIHSNLDRCCTVCGTACIHVHVTYVCVGCGQWVQMCLSAQLYFGTRLFCWTAMVEHSQLLIPAVPEVETKPLLAVNFSHTQHTCKHSTCTCAHTHTHTFTHTNTSRGFATESRLERNWPLTWQTVQSPWLSPSPSGLLESSQYRSGGPASSPLPLWWPSGPRGKQSRGSSAS